MDNYRGIGESDKLLAEANDLRWKAERELVTACKRIVELEAENASLRARLSEVDSWQQGEVPEGVDRIEVNIPNNNFFASRTNNHFHTHSGLYVNPAESGYVWREVK